MGANSSITRGAPWASRVTTLEHLSLRFQFILLSGLPSIPGSAFHCGQGGDRFARFCFAQPMELIEDAAECLGNLG